MPYSGFRQETVRPFNFAQMYWIDEITERKIRAEGRARIAWNRHRERVLCEVVSRRHKTLSDLDHDVWEALESLGEWPV